MMCVITLWDVAFHEEKEGAIGVVSPPPPTHSTAVEVPLTLMSSFSGGYEQVGAVGKMLRVSPLCFDLKI